MARWPRRAFNLLSCLSLLYCIWLIVGWLRFRMAIASFEQQFGGHTHVHDTYIAWTPGPRVPLWLGIATSAALPAVWLGLRIPRLLRRRRRPGACRRCGYDLRATPERCPECGTAASG